MKYGPLWPHPMGEIFDHWKLAMGMGDGPLLYDGGACCQDYHGECITKLKSDDFGRNFSKIQLKRRSELLFQIGIPISSSTRIPCLPESG